MIDFNSTEAENIGIEEIKYVPLTDNCKTQELIPENVIRKPDTLFLYFTVVTAMLTMFSGATTIVWASPALVKLKSNNTNENPLGRPVTAAETSMILGTPLTVALIGTLFLPKLADILGRKRSLQIVGLGMLVNIIGLAFSSRLELIIIFASLSTGCFSSLFTLLPVYLTEICEDHNRGKFGCFISVFSPLGTLYTYVVGTMFNLRYFTLLTAAPLIPFQLLFLFAPETPVYLLTKGKTEECMKALKKLRSNKTNAELQIDFQKISQNVSALKKKEGKNIITLLKTKEGRMGVLLATVLMVFRNLSGVPVVTSLLAPIFNETGSTKLSGNTAAIIVGIVSAISSIFPCLVIEKFGRKPLLISSTVGVAFWVTVLGSFFFLKHINSSIINNIQWLPVICVSFYVIFYFIGLGPIPVAIPGELFLSDIRSVAVAFIMSTSLIVLCFVAYSYPLLANAFGTHWCLWMFGVCCFSGAVIMYIIMPETRGKNILEIQEILKNH